MFHVKHPADAAFPRQNGSAAVCIPAELQAKLPAGLRGLKSEAFLIDSHSVVGLTLGLVVGLGCV